MRIVEFFSDEGDLCSYFNDRCSHFRYFYIQECSARFCEGLVERGWRRFGEYFFVPICNQCKDCVSIRQVVADFALTRSYKRVIAKNANTHITISRPSLSDEKIDLYHRYHTTMQRKKQWQCRPTNDQIYSENFIYGYCDYGYEILYRINGRLVGVGYFDLLPQSISAIYFFYDHTYSAHSLGTFNILTQILIAKEKQLAYFYPGYWIPDHYSMGYKNRFMPFEILCNQPDLFETPVWKAYNKDLVPSPYKSRGIDSVDSALSSEKIPQVDANKTRIVFKRFFPQTTQSKKAQPNLLRVSHSQTRIITGTASKIKTVIKQPITPSTSKKPDSKARRLSSKSKPRQTKTYGAKT